MAALREIAFGSPLLVVALLAAAAVLLASGAWRRRSRRLALAAGALGAVSLALVVLDAVVVTDREWIDQRLSLIVDQAVDGRLDALADLLDDSFAGQVGSGRVEGPAAATALARQALDRYGVTDVRLANRRTEVQGPAAQTRVLAFVRFRRPRGRAALELPVRRSRRGGGWRISGIDVGPAGRP